VKTSSNSWFGRKHNEFFKFNFKPEEEEEESTLL
jgi:hypothetical protein